MKELSLSDRDIFALSKVLNTAIEKADFCYEGNRHARIVTLKLQQYINKRIEEEGKDYENLLNI